MAKDSFQSLEHAGWLAKASEYDRLFATITRQSMDAILQTFGDLAGKRLLDVACGPGLLAGKAHSLGAQCEGIDFASTMVDKARSLFPDVTFIEGNAEQLPYPDSQFDAVACSFGLLHLEHPERAVKEALRVLTPGGNYTFTVWRSPDQGGEFFQLVMGAIQKHGSLDVPLPPSPPMFRFAEPEQSENLLKEAGFIDSKSTVLPLTWNAKQPEDILEMIYKSIVRMPMILEAQSPHARERINEEIMRSSEKHRNTNGIQFQFPALMATGRKADNCR